MNQAVDMRTIARRARPAATRIESAVLAIVLLLMAESMLFAGLLTACALVRSRAVGLWPPIDLPRFPWPVTLATTFALLATVPLVSFGRAYRRQPLLLAATSLGGVFLAVHGLEWVRMLSRSSVAGSYGAIFYCLVGVHALHVLGGLVALSWATCTMHHPNTAVRLKVCGMYWYFVVAVWPVIYAMVYH